MKLSAFILFFIALSFHAAPLSLQLLAHLSRFPSPRCLVERQPPPPVQQLIAVPRLEAMPHRAKRVLSPLSSTHPFFLSPPRCCHTLLHAERHLAAPETSSPRLCTAVQKPSWGGHPCSVRRCFPLAPSSSRLRWHNLLASHRYPRPRRSSSPGHPNTREPCAISLSSVPSAQCPSPFFPAARPAPGAIHCRRIDDAVDNRVLILANSNPTSL